MFDFGFGEISLILVIALVVLGPERLPKLARTIGNFIGKTRHFVSTVKSELSQQIDSTDLKSLKDTANTLRQNVTDSMQTLEETVRSAHLSALDSLPEQKTPDDFLPKYIAPEKKLKQKSVQTRRQTRTKFPPKPKLRGSRRNK